MAPFSFCQKSDRAVWGSRGQRDATTSLRARGPPSLAPSGVLPAASSPTTLFLHPHPRLRETDGAERPGLWGVLAGGGAPKRGTRSHQGPGGGCCPSQRPSWGPRRAGGCGAWSKLLRAEAQPLEVCVEKCTLLGHPLILGRLMPLSSGWLVWFDVTAESQQGRDRNYPWWCKNP